MYDVSEETTREAGPMPELPRGEERRMVHRLLEHWRDARNGGELPSLDAVYARKLGAIASQLIVLDVTGEGPVFKMVGPFFVELVGQNLAGRPVSAVPRGSLIERAVYYYEEVLKRKVPISLGQSFVDVHGRTVLYRSIILPLSDDGTTVSQLLCAANSRVVVEEDGP